MGHFLHAGSVCRGGEHYQNLRPLLKLGNRHSLLGLPTDYVWIPIMHWIGKCPQYCDQSLREEKNECASINAYPEQSLCTIEGNPSQGYNVQCKSLSSVNLIYLFWHDLAGLFTDGSLNQSNWSHLGFYVVYWRFYSTGTHDRIPLSRSYVIKDSSYTWC